MNADQLRARLLMHLRDDLELDVIIQGKRIVVRDGLDTTLILVTAARVDDVRERQHLLVERDV